MSLLNLSLTSVAHLLPSKKNLRISFFCVCVSVNSSILGLENAVIITDCGRGEGVGLVVASNILTLLVLLVDVGFFFNFFFFYSHSSSDAEVFKALLIQ